MILIYLHLAFKFIVGFDIIYYTKICVISVDKRSYNTRL